MSEIYFLGHKIIHCGIFRATTSNEFESLTTVKQLRCFLMQFIPHAAEQAGLENFLKDFIIPK